MRGLFYLTLTLAVFLTLSCGQVSPDKNKTAGRQAPDFALSDLEGNNVRLSAFRNDKNVLLVFGATRCPYCVKEIPELKEIYKKYKDDEVKIVYIDIRESAQKVAAFAKDYSIPYTVLIDPDGAVAASYGVLGIPHQAIVDKNGLLYYEGPRPSGGLISLIDKLLK